MSCKTLSLAYNAFNLAILIRKVTTCIVTYSHNTYHSYSLQPLEVSCKNMSLAYNAFNLAIFSKKDNNLHSLLIDSVLIAVNNYGGEVTFGNDTF